VGASRQGAAGEQPVSGLEPGGSHHLAGAGTEIALGVLTGRERAQAIEHLQQCSLCRARVDGMAFTSDELLRLLPGQQPPAGFSTQATDRLRRARKASRRSRMPRALATAAAVALVGTAGLAGWGLRTAPGPSGPARPTGSAALRTAALITPTGHQAIGKVYLHSGKQTWMFATVDLAPGDRTIICQLTDQAGHVITVGSFHLTGGDGYWGSPEPDQPAAITSARLITAAGTVLATATFGTTR
jgi:hypothetical protein